MGDVPINPTGFAHGFRPLEGDHPPPTPTQRDLILRPGSNGHQEQFSADCNGLSFLSASSRATTQNPVVDSSLGPSRKKRRFPGPLAFLQHGGLSKRRWACCVPVVLPKTTCIKYLYSYFKCLQVYLFIKSHPSPLTILEHSDGTYRLLRG